MIALVTTNAHKIAEAQGCLALLGVPISLVGVTPAEDVEETGLTFQENAHIKLQAALLNPLPAGTTWVVAEDAGLIVDALNGLYGLSPFPGIQSDRWLTPAIQREVLGHITPNPDYAIKNEAILALLHNHRNRSARYEACLAIHHLPTHSTQFVTGITPLTVALCAQGTGGFGYDPIMRPDTPGDPRAMGQRSPQEKNSLSHRLAAWQQFQTLLANVI